MELFKLEEFLKNVDKIYNEIPKKEITFLDISGFPHYENVCSNILAFYLNPKEEHGLGNLVLNSLIEAIKDKVYNVNINMDELDDIKIYREFSTNKGNRIDLIIKSKDFVIGIENKIEASIYNDLEDYANTIDGLNRNSYRIVLSLYDNSDIVENTKFENITYRELFKKIKNNIKHLNSCNNKWLIYLKDFMVTLGDKEIDENMQEDLKNWVKENNNEIKKVFEIVSTVQNEFKDKIDEYKKLMENYISGVKVNEFKDNENIAITKYILFDKPDQGYNLDVRLNLDGWDIGVFIWKNKSYGKVMQMFEENSIKILEERDKHEWIYHFDYNCTVEEVMQNAYYIYMLLNAL